MAVQHRTGSIAQGLLVSISHPGQFLDGYPGLISRKGHADGPTPRLAPLVDSDPRIVDLNNFDPN